MIIIFEGPEKAGKTTLVTGLMALLAIKKFKVKTRKFSGPMTSENQYLHPLFEDAKDPETIVLWDRGWVSEWAYSTWFGRNSTLQRNPDRADVIFTSVVDLFGLKYIVLPEDVHELTGRRDSTDLSIDPGVEYRMFKQYAAMFNWPIIKNDYTAEVLASNCFRILADIERLRVRYEDRTAVNK